jgi:hypothetical protein
MLTWKDSAATAATAAVVFVFAAANERWGVPLVGESRRWAAGVIFAIGFATCGLGSPAGRGSRLFALLGVAALVLASAAIATASFTLVSLLVVDIVVMWAVATARHMSVGPRRRAAT